MTPSPILTGPEFGLLVLAAALIIASRAVWSLVKKESTREH